MPASSSPFRKKYPMASPKKAPSKPSLQAVDPSNPFGIVAEAPKTAKPKAKGKEREQVELGSKLDKLAAFKVIEKLLEDEGKLIQNEVKEEVITLFAEKAHESGKKPESFVGLGERAQASCELRRRGSNMPISPEVADELTQLGIPFEKNIKVPERFVINPALDQETLMHLGKLVQNDPLLKGKNVVMKQAEEHTQVVSEETIEALAKNTSVETCKMLLEKVATFAIGKFNFDGCAIEDGDKHVTENAKAIAISLLQEMGVLPQAAIIEKSKKRA